MTPQPAAAPAKKSNVTLFIILGVAAMGACCVFGILAAIAIPNFVRYQAKAKQSEGRVAIKSVDIAQRSHFAEHDAYSTDTQELGLQPGTRFTCFVSSTPAFEALGLDVAPGVTGDCPECQYTGVCTGNIDDDETLDVWSISSVDRPCGKAGVACNDVNDLER